jgi:hypothetical protein
MTKFNVNDKAYSIRWGLCVIEDVTDDDERYCVRVRGMGEYEHKSDWFMEDGRSSYGDVNPSILTLDEARRMGYVIPKAKVKKNITVYGVVSTISGSVLDVCLTRSEAEQSSHDNVQVVKLTGTCEVEE